MFVLVLAHTKTKPGRAWAAIRQSESAALAAGINTTLYKLWAFALASFITGVAGGVLAGAVHYLYSIGFPTQDSITLLAVTLMGGVYSLWGAVVAALLYQFLPALLNNWGVSADWLIILFGLGVLQVLTTAPAGLADQVPRDLARLGRLLRSRLGKPATRGVLDAISFVGLDAGPDTRVRTLGAGQRRLVEVARAVVGRPGWSCSTSPPPACPTRRLATWAKVIRRIPEHTGALAILVDHDMSLVSACCQTTAVLDFGRLIASGPTADVLRDDAVIRAYLGVA